MENPCTYLEGGPLWFEKSAFPLSILDLREHGNVIITNFTGVWLFRRKLMRCIELEGMCHLIPTEICQKTRSVSQHRRKNDDGGTVSQLSYDFSFLKGHKS